MKKKYKSKKIKRVKEKCRIDSDKGGVTIEQAYKELSIPAFAFWIRLLIANEKDLLGRAKVANLTKYSLARSNVILRELKYKGYIEVISDKYPGLPTKIIVTKKALLYGPSNFITLSNIVNNTHNIKDEQKILKNNDLVQLKQPLAEIDNFLQIMPTNKRKKSVKQIKFIKSQKIAKFCKSLPKINKPILSLKNNRTEHSKNTGRDGEKQKKEPIFKSKNSSLLTFQIIPKNIENIEKNKFLNKFNVNVLNSIHKSKTIEPYVCNKLYIDSYYNKNININTHTLVSLTQKVKKRKEKAYNLEEKSRKNSPENKLLIRLREEKEKNDGKRKRKKSKGFPKELDWIKLDQRGNPTISFNLKGQKLREVLAILDRDNRDTTKKQFLNKLGTEFGRIYSRYRRLLQKESGLTPSYHLPTQERKYARKAAEWCIRKGVTPRQVLSYWHANISNFAESMKIPPLAFLSSPANIDRVACADLNKKEKINNKQYKNKHSENQENMVVNRNSFSDISQLNSNLREILEKAGFSTKEWNDRYLLSLQKISKNIASGHDIFIPNHLRSVVNWIADNFYNKKG